MTTSCLVLMLIQVTVTLAHVNMRVHTQHTWQLKLSHWCIISTHAHCATVVCADKYTNPKCFVSHDCSQAVKRVRILDTLLQLASLHMHLTDSHTVAHHFSPPSYSPSPFLSTMKSLCTSARCSKQIWLQRPAPHRASWHTGRGSTTHRHPGQDTRHQHHPNPPALKGI